MIVRRPGRDRWLVIGGLALAASLLLIIFGWSSLGKKQTEINDLTKTLDRLSANNAGDANRPSVDQIVGEVGAIDEWKLRDVNWLGELKQLSDRMLTPDDIMVDSLTASAGRGTPQLVMKSRVKSVPKENELLASLRGRPYVLNPDRSEEKSDKDYPLGLDLRLSYVPDLAELIQQMNVHAVQFLQQQQQNQQQQAVPAEAPQ